MNYNVQLSNGQLIELTNAEFDAVAFTAVLNDQKTIFVNLGGAIVNKHLISAIVPTSEEK